MKVWKPTLAVAILLAVGLGVLFALLPQPDVPVAAEALLALIAVVLAAAMLLASWRLAFRSKELKEQQRLISGAFALLAFLPIWICTQIIWQSIHHSNGGYPGWFWIVLAVGAVIAILWVGIPLLLGLIRMVGVALVIIAIVCISWFGPVLAAGSSASVNHSSGSSTTSTPSSTPTTCLWKMLAPPNNGNLIEDGVPAIESAVTSAQAKEAAEQWLTKLQVYPGVLAFVANPVLHEQVNPSTLVANGCATQTASNLVEQMQSAIASAQVTPATLPASGTNSTTQGNQVIIYNYTNGGGQKAVKIVLPDGTTIYVEAKCGNIVTPPCPSGTSPSKLIPSICVAPKNPAQNILVNPSVPAQVKGQGSTSPGASPSAAASSPTDSATGCNGPCPGASPTPTPSSSPPTNAPIPTPIASQPVQTTSPPQPSPPSS
jgi:uncharacterized membrane protein YozB (DUF420 family)